MPKIKFIVDNQMIIKNNLKKLEYKGRYIEYCSPVLLLGKGIY